METSKDITSGTKKQPQSTGLVLTDEEKKRLTDYFSILIEIDRKKNITKYYGQPTN